MMPNRPLLSLPAMLAGMMLTLAGCAQSACSDPDVLSFVDQARRSRDLYAVGLLSAPVRETPLGTSRTAICSAWLLSRNPAWQPGSRAPRTLRVRQDFEVSKLDSGYEVGLLPR